MAIALGLAAALLVGALGLLVLFPPQRAHWWRHHTRPIRRRLRPGHYRW